MVVNFFIIHGIHTLRHDIVSAQSAVVVTPDIYAVGTDHLADIFAVFEQICHHGTVKAALHFQIFLRHIGQNRCTQNIGFTLFIFAPGGGRLQGIIQVAVLLVLIVLVQVRRFVGIRYLIEIFHIHNDIIFSVIVFVGRCRVQI